MEVPEKRDFHARVFLTKHQYKGRRSKRKWTAPATGGSSAERPSNGDGEVRDLDSASFIRSVVDFVSAPERKIRMFDNENKRQNKHGSTFICDIGAIRRLISGAACTNCGRRDLSVRELEGKRKGLASFLELYCGNDACPTTIISSTYTSSRVSRPFNDSEETPAHGSAHDSFAVNVKSVLAPRSAPDTNSQCGFVQFLVLRNQCSIRPSLQSAKKCIMLQRKPPPPPKTSRESEN